jgi:hypothetical protein
VGVGKSHEEEGMRQYLSAVVVGAATAVMLLTAIAAAQAPVTLQDQLAAQYNVAKMAGSGTVVVETGTVLAVQKGGILSLPWRALALCPAKFQDNALPPPTGFCAGVMLHNYFQKGTKVYPLKIEVSVDKAKITFRVVSCDECNGVDPPTGFKGEVVFQFAKGYLEKAGAGEVENTIGQVFAISDDQQQDQAGGQQEKRAGGRYPAANCQAAIAAAATSGASDSPTRHDHRSGAVYAWQARQSVQSWREADLCLQRRESDVH